MASRMHRIATVQRFGRYCILILLCVCHHPVHAQTRSTELKPYTAEFSVRKKGIAIGHVSISLKKEKATWRYTTHAEPAGLAALFSSDRIHETSLVYVNKDRILPYRHHTERLAKSKQETLKIDYNQANRTASSTYNGTLKTLPLTTPLYDSQSLQLALILDLKNNRLKKEYAIIEKNVIKRYPLQLEGEEVLATPLGELKTIKLTRLKGRRKITVWYAKTLHYLPVQFGEYKNGQQETLMKLLSLSINSE